MNKELRNVIETNEIKLNLKQNEINDLNNKLQKSLEIIDLNSKNEMNLFDKIKQMIWMHTWEIKKIWVSGMGLGLGFFFEFLCIVEWNNKNRLWW